MQLANQEAELVSLLKKLPLEREEITVVRKRAELLCEGRLDRGQAVLPIKLSTFLFQVLVKIYGESEEDKELGFKAALSALSKWYMYEKGAHLLLREVIPSKML